MKPLFARALRAADAFWYAPTTALRVALLRVLLGGFATVYVATRYVAFSSVAHFTDAEFVPVGLVSWLGHPPVNVVGLHAAILLTILLGVGFSLGVLYRVTAPVFGLALLWLTSYRNSWGMLFHTEHLLVLQILVLAAAPAADALSWDDYRARQRSAAHDVAPHGRYCWPARLMSLILVVCYMLAGLAKLKLAGVGWFHGDFLRAQVAMDNLRKIELGAEFAPLGAALVRHAWPFSTLAAITMVVELGAPIALLGGRWALAWVIAAWGFHVAILGTMAIVFPYQLALLAYASLFQCERWLELPRAQRLKQWLLTRRLLVSAA
jgi:hypothetical protein